MSLSMHGCCHSVNTLGRTGPHLAAPWRFGGATMARDKPLLPQLVKFLPVLLCTSHNGSTLRSRETGADEASAGPRVGRADALG